ncbi:synaptotagmin-C-like [Rhopilema esculentum]|uniref:synaptotagmin-C-like n=1 Tax=Rhopilema esculentum TaxID=499914 RepID=UPI0031DA6847|eukprot:gene11637-21879_t
MSHDAGLTTKEEILLAVSISFAALFIATVITLLIARYWAPIKEWCMKHLPCFQGMQEKKDANENVPMTNSKVPLVVLGQDENPFVIPGSIVSERVQPDMKSTRSGSVVKTASEPSKKPPKTKKKISRALDTRHSIFAVSESDQQRKMKKQQKMMKSKSVYLSDLNPQLLRRNALSKSETTLNDKSILEQISPELYMTSSRSEESISDVDKEDSLYSSFLPVRGFLSSPGSSPVTSDDENGGGGSKSSLLELRPELYDTSRKRSVGFGTLGKIKMSLQYLNHDKTKLELFFQYMDQLQLRPGVIGIQVGITLLPERENMYHSKMHQATDHPIFEQSFVFKRTLPNDSFNTKTIRFHVYILQGQEKRRYGESNMPLARSEIFGQIKTDNVLNINPPSQTTEVGDVLIEIFYTKTDEFHALIRTVRLASTTSVDQLSALQVKAYLKKKRRKVGESQTKMISLTNEREEYIQLNLDLKHKIPWATFMEHSLHVTVSGKHRILGRVMKIGKVILGENAVTMADNIHWKSIMNSPGAPYNLWHILHGY